MNEYEDDYDEYLDKDEEKQSSKKDHRHPKPEDDIEEFEREEDRYNENKLRNRRPRKDSDDD